MEIVAHGLWAAAGAITVRRFAVPKLSIGWSVWWAVFPDVFAFGPPVVAGVWLRLSGYVTPGMVHTGHLPRIHLGLPLYPLAHSLLTFILVFGLASLVARRPLWPMAGWLLHILIDIPTHSYRYHATRFLWPLSGFAVDGIPWWTPWFWVSTYAALSLVYALLWSKGWLRKS